MDTCEMGNQILEIREVTRTGTISFILQSTPYRQEHPRGHLSHGSWAGGRAVGAGTSTLSD